MKKCIKYSTLDSHLEKKISLDEIQQPMMEKLMSSYASGEFPELGNVCSCLVIRFCQILWKWCDRVGMTLDSLILPPTYLCLRASSLNLWALVSAFWKPYEIPPAMYFPYSGKGNGLHSPKWCCVSIRFLLLLITLHGCSSLSLSLLVMFGTLHNWPSLWSVYCLVKAFVKSQGLYNWGLILLAMTSLIMDLAGQPGGTWMSPSSCIVSRKVTLPVAFFQGFSAEGGQSKWGLFSLHSPLSSEEDTARSVLAWLAYLTNRTDITTITAATCFQNVEIKMARGRVREGVMTQL